MSKTRVAILGGGCGGVSAAFWLTSPELRDRFDVTLYTHGWRLGGKAASGRNADNKQRIEEHGLHISLGFYRNAFETLKACYDELDPGWNNRFKTVDEAFTPLRSVVLMENVPDGAASKWEQWKFDFPCIPGKPWDGDPLPLGWSVVTQILGWLQGQTGQFKDANPGAFTTLLERLEATLGFSGPLLPDQLLDEAIKLAEPIGTGPIADTNPLNGVLHKLQGRFLDSVPHLIEHSSGYELCVLGSLAVALLKGLLLNVFIRHDSDLDEGFDRINDRDFKEWLQKDGGLDAKYAWAAPVRALYDLAFAYEGGDSGSADNAKLAAGAALKTLLRMALSYKDAPLWKMNAGMGDVVFAPLYQVLSQRKVPINFFHRLKNLKLSADKTRIEEIALTRQVEVIGGSYDPLCDVNGLKCWPSQPKWPLIVNGVQTKDTAWNLESVHCNVGVDAPPLKLGRDFDAVILAIPPASLEFFASDLLQHCDRIREMHENTHLISTQSVQLWRAGEIEPPFIPRGDLIGAYAEPFNTWANMSHLVAQEEWRDLAKSCEYYCGTMQMLVAMPTRDIKAHADSLHDSVKNAFMAWTGQNAPPSPQRPEPQPIVSEYYHANSDPSELYVLTLLGTVSFRLDPDGAGVENLYLAGDWTRSSINGGSAEAAFESGRKAAELIAKKFAAPAG